MKVTYEYQNREIMKIMAEFYFGKDFVRVCTGAIRQTGFTKMNFYKKGVGCLIVHRK